MKNVLRISGILLVCLLLSACSILNTDYFAEEIPTSNPQSMEEMALYQTLQARIEKEMMSGEDLPTQYQYLNALLSSISFTVLSVDENQCIMVIRGSFVDVMAMADTFGDAEISIEEYYEGCLQQMQSGKAPTTEKTLSIPYEVTYEQGEKIYTISNSEGLAELLSCGAYSAAKNMGLGE